MFEAYSVGIKLQLIDGVTSGLTAISRLFAKTGEDAKALESQLTKIKALGMIGGAAADAGSKGLGIIGKMVKPAEEYAHQLAQMNVSGMKQVEIAKAVTAAWDAGKSAPTSTPTENLKTIRELRSALGDTEEAIKYMPVVQQIDGVLQCLLDMEGGQAHSQALGVAKALKAKGVKTPQELSLEANLMTKAMVASGGELSSADFQTAFNRGGTAALGWNNDFAYGILPTLIREMKAGGGGNGDPGSGMMSAYSTIAGGTFTRESSKLWGELGLVDPSKAAFTKDGQLKSIAPGGIVGTAEFKSNPYAWIQQYLVPSLKKHGYTDENSQRLVIQRLFPNGMAGSLIAQMALQSSNFEKNRGLINQSGGLESYNQLLKSDPKMAKTALSAQWESLKTSLGSTLDLTKAYTRLREIVQSVVDWTRRHTTITGVLVKAFGGLSAALTLGGTVLKLIVDFMMLRSIFKGLGTAVDFKWLFSIFRTLGTVVSASFRGLLSIFRTLWTVLTAGFRGLLMVFGALRTVLTYVRLGFMLITMGLKVLAATVGAPVLIIVAIVAAIAGAAYLIWRNWDYIGPKLKACWEGIKSAVGAFADWLSKKWQWIKSFLPSSWFESSSKPDTVRPGASNNQKIHLSAYVDKYRLLDFIYDGQTEAASRPPAGTYRVDTRMTAQPVGVAI